MNNLHIADVITSECKKKNIKTTALLQDCNINHSFISDLKHKNHAPSIDKISAIADYLGLSVDYILGRTDNPLVTHKLPEVSDETLILLISVFKELDFFERTEVMNLITNLAKKKA